MKQHRRFDSPPVLLWRLRTSHRFSSFSDRMCRCAVWRKQTPNYSSFDKLCSQKTQK